jgi:hypothetical protein
MKLFLVHCGYYDSEVLDGNYESHVNFFVAASDFDDARARVKLLPDFVRKRMHVDGLQEVQAVSGYRLALQEDSALQGATVLLSNKHRDLAPKKPAPMTPDAAAQH